MKRLYSKLVFMLLLGALLIQPVSAVKIVRLELEYGRDDFIAADGFNIPKTNTVLDLELYENETPVTVANFLNYVDSGRYDLTFFNRSVPGFSLLAGGVNNISTDPVNESLGTSFGKVEEFLPILNEPGLSNIRGSIGMAKESSLDDKATSRWYINLNDNSNLLDINNNNIGFTVFGSIIDDGIEIAEQIETFSVFDLELLFGSSYSDLPLADYGESVFVDALQGNLVMILRATEISRPILRFAPADGNFGTDVFGDTSSKLMDVKLKNTGNQTLDVGAIRIDAINAPFSIQSENCSNATLKPVSVAPASFCAVSLQFLAETTGMFNDSLTIDYTSQLSGDSFSVKYLLLGEGSVLGVPEIATVDTFDVGTSQVAGFVVSNELKINNIGQDPLQILGIEIAGLSASSYTQTNDCIDSVALILPGSSCTIVVNFAANNFGKETATLSINSNDPVNNIVDIKLSGIGARDSDGVVSVIEDASPNSGDANFDGVVDSQQNNVASFSDSIGNYLSLVVDDSYALTDFSVTFDVQNNNLPTDIIFKHGILEYNVIVQPPGAVIEVGLVLPSGDEPKAFYLFGETADNETPHWYLYPATQVFANVSFSSSVKNLIKLTVQDGGVGDADQEVNGKIQIGPGVVSYTSKGDGGSSGFINIVFIGFLFILALVSKRYRYSKNISRSCFIL